MLYNEKHSGENSQKEEAIRGSRKELQLKKKTVRDGSMRGHLSKDLKQVYVDIEEEYPRQRESQRKGPEVEAFLVRLRSSKEARVTEVKRAKGQ